MRTLILSDLHLGSLSGSDLLRRPELRAPLLERVSQVDRVVLLGDVLELRHGPPREAMAAARPFFEDLGRALGEGELVVTSGNHDHALVEPWLAGRGLDVQPTPLSLEQLIEPADASPALELMADWAAPARTRVAYPGLWVRPDIYAMHGHYLDAHLTVPTLERLSIAAMSRVLGRPASSFSSVSDYESVSAPVFAWRDAVARDTRTGAALNGYATVTAWSALRERGGADRAGASNQRRRRLDRVSLVKSVRRRAIVTGFPVAVALLNRAGLGPLKAEISTSELRRAGLSAMGDVAARLGLDEAHVVFGHTHRAGPLPGDDQREWRGRSGAHLVNSGSWTYAPVFLTDTPGESPYWPGSCVLVEDTGPPVLEHLLGDRGHAELAPTPRRAKAQAQANAGAPTL
ncbi:MAG TPA: hypothetical protein VHT29_11855 [Solirubrobacteraceae bacterium]|nr:hypothetical protein [Solirubrobacteraceae bacterium]